MAGRLIVSDTPEDLADRAAGDFVKWVDKTLAIQDRCTIALAGGQTPKGLYERLAKEPYKSSIPWKKLWFFWGDERCVPKEHPESNYRMAWEALLQYVPVPHLQVVRMHGEDPPPQAAHDYEKGMREIFKNDGNWPRIDLILLGMGPDGHTASLIPGTSAVEAGTDQPPLRWVVDNVVRARQTVRLTFTFPVINQAKNVWFLVTGANKAAVFADVQKGPNPNWPASRVQPVQGELRWYVDKSIMTLMSNAV